MLSLRESLLEAQASDVEHGLQSLLRSCQEQAGLAKHMAENERKRNHHARAAELAERAREQQANVELIGRLLDSGNTATHPGQVAMGDGGQSEQAGQ